MPGLGVVGDSPDEIARLIREAIPVDLGGLRGAGDPIPTSAAVTTALAEVPGGCGHARRGAGGLALEPTRT